MPGHVDLIILNLIVITKLKSSSIINESFLSTNNNKADANYGLNAFKNKVLNNGCGFDRGRIKVVAISGVTDVALQIAVIAV